MAGEVLAVLVVMATLTFGASLNTLVSHPALYGWNFSYALYGVDGWGPIPSSVSTPLLAADHSVAATTGVYFATVQIDGQTVPGIAAPARAAVAPPVLTEHGVDGSRQIVLGPATMAQLHKRVGDTVWVSENSLVPRIRLRITGTAPLPAVGTTLSVHPSMSTGALFSSALLSAQARDQFGPFSGPNAIFVRLRPGASQAPGGRFLTRIAQDLTRLDHSPRVLAAFGPVAFEVNVKLLPAQQPAEIVNYKSMGTMPAILAGGLAAGAVAGLGLTLVASVRRRRRDFALLKTLGFTRRQLAGAVAWQSTVIALVGLVIGVPLGIASGRLLWLAFARQLSAVPDPVVPALSVILAAVGALVLANVVAAIPARQAARTPAALLLRAE